MKFQEDAFLSTGENPGERHTVDLGDTSLIFQVLCPGYQLPLYQPRCISYKLTNLGGSKAPLLAR